MAKAIKVTTKALDDAQSVVRNLTGLTSAAERLEQTRQRLIEMLSELDGPIEEALKAVNGRAESFCITSAHTVRSAAKDAEALLAARGVTLKNRVGAIHTYTPAGPSANSYKYPSKSTTITLKRVSDGWRLVDVEATNVYPKTPERRDTVVSQDAAEDIKRAAFAGIRVAVPNPFEPG